MKKFLLIFLLRGYCPLTANDLVSFNSEGSGKRLVRKQITSTIKYFESAAEIVYFNDRKILTDKVGLTDMALLQSSFIHQYIIPNFSFHMSMLYTIARVWTS